MSNITVRDLYKSYDDNEIIKGINFKVKEGELVTLLGPSGCGKSTTLRILAGLEHHQKGQVYFNDQIIVDPEQNIFTPPEKRDMGMVFQSYAIWPHMNVFENVAYPLKLKKENRQTIRKKVEEVLEMVGLAQYIDRPSTRLSGGQQQRLALARAIVAQPKILLLDEPLSNLDAQLREQMRFELKQLHSRIGMTTIYVTHDQSESLSLSDKIIVMKDGKIEQIGTPEEIYHRPKSYFVSQFIGKTNVLKGKVVGIQDNRHTIQIKEAKDNLLIECIHEPVDVKLNDDVLIGIRPENIQLSNGIGDEGHQNIIPFEVLDCLYFGSHIEYEIRLGNCVWNIHFPSDVRLKPGQWVHLVIPREKCVIFSDDIQN